MKKTLAILLTGICLTLVGCSESTNENASVNSASATTIAAAAENTSASADTASSMQQNIGDSESTAASAESSSAASPSASADDSADYSVCTSISTADVDAFASKAKEAFLTNDWGTVSEMCAYPITIGGTEYADADSLQTADITLSDSFITAMNNESCTGMFANYMGIMMGDGEVWISEVLNEDGTSQGLKIISINN